MTKEKKHIHIENSARRRIEKTAKRMVSTLGYTIIPTADLNNERIVEYPWALGHIGTSNGCVLDIGCSGSELSLKLAIQGFDVYGVDVYQKDIKAQGHPKFGFVKCDTRWLPFVDESFDFVIAISTIEHIGIGFYGDFEDQDGDIKSLREILRVSKKNGKSLVTVPYGKWSITSMQRTYDESGLRRLLAGLAVEAHVDYFVKRNHLWMRSNKEAAGQSASKNVESVACINFLNNLSSSRIKTIDYGSY